MRGNDRHYRLEVGLLDAVNGATHRIILPEGTSFEVVIPPGAHDHQTLRLSGRGEASTSGGDAGDALIEIYPAQVRTRKSLGEMMRKLSVT